MQTRTQKLAAALALAAAANGHIIMSSPAPFGSVGPNKSITSSPLTSSNYPCQVGSNPATFYSKDGLDNKMTIGQPQTISFTGSAVHGGGSCQLALTKDPQPSASTSWQVILSIEGGCPSKSGTGTDSYQFTVPDSIAPGDYVFAWTWISKLSGTQEYYMNCAPVTISGGSGKREVYNNETELFTRDAGLPELMVANLAEINSCKSVLSTDPTYPNPGPNVLKPGTNNKFTPITGTNCVPKGAKDVSSPAPDSSSSSAAAGGSSPSSSAAAGGSPSSSAAAGGGTFMTTPTSAAASSPTSAAGGAQSSSAAATHTSAAAHTSAAGAASSSSGFQTIPKSSSAAATPSSHPSSSAPAAGPSGTPGSGSEGGLSGPCTTEGMFNCIDGVKYQQCASGSWSTLMDMPATTKCAPGQTMTLWARNLNVGRRDMLKGHRRGY
ncbi:hypothetical protein GGR51DRAFT_249967 [Nemania sp. FL0031]|nr:hypothetical protein GGR51DRAFT_249967 [Nemania sp. FL0031]